MANAQLKHKIVYWQNPINKEIRMGLPEAFSAPWGWDKIVCGTALQAEWWSEQLRKQDKIREEVKWAEREAVEGPMQEQLNSHMRNLMANAKNNVTKEFLRRHLERYAKKPKPWEWKRVSYLHSEGFEEGH